MFLMLLQLVVKGTFSKWSGLCSENVLTNIYIKVNVTFNRRKGLDLFEKNAVHLGFELVQMRL